jgi:hypothetical protein
MTNPLSKLGSRASADQASDTRLPPEVRGDLRRMTGLSLYELASETGIDRNRLIGWEDGERLLYSETNLVIDALVSHSGKRLPELLRMHRRGLLTRRTHITRKVHKNVSTRTR